MIYPHLAINPQGHLTFSSYDTTALAAEYGTPLMVMDETLIRNRCREYKRLTQQEHLSFCLHFRGILSLIPEAFRRCQYKS